jgi:hypothetical protein
MGDKYFNLVEGVNFGATSQFKRAQPKLPGPKNRRAEMWGRSKEALEQEEGFSLPDMDVLQGDATAPMLKVTATNDWLLESKEQMKARGVRSPDLWDAIALTFADLKPITDYEDRKKRISAMATDKIPASAAWQYGTGIDQGWMG